MMKRSSGRLLDAFNRQQGLIPGIVSGYLTGWAGAVAAGFASFTQFLKQRIGDKFKDSINVEFETTSELGKWGSC